MGWKIAFGLSWLVAGMPYFLLVTFLVQLWRGEGDLNNPLGMVIAVIPAAICGIIQAILGQKAFRK